MRTFTLLLISMSCYVSVFSQRQCSTPEYQERISRENPLTSFMIQGAPAMSASTTAGTAGIDGALPVIVIPVVVHVLYTNDGNNIGEAQIKAQLDILNNDFNMGNADISKVPAAFASRTGAASIRFELAKVDPDGRATSGINRKRSAREFWANDDKVKTLSYGGVVPWDSRYYLNIWVCNLVPGLLGYSSAPGSPADRDGVVIKYSVFGAGSGSFNKGRTAVHEIGHWLNLKHLWGDAECGSDGVDDTPQQRTYNQGSPTFPKLNTVCGNADPAGEMFMNFMDFTNDEVMVMFTAGQVKRMRSTFDAAGARHSMLSTKALGTPWNTGSSEVISSPAPPTSASQPSVPSVRIVMYPNPATNAIIVNSKEVTLSGKTYEIFAADGRLMKKGIFNSESYKVSVDQLKSGVYFLRISGVTPVGRFIKR